jgi:hypothetical protein
MHHEADQHVAEEMSETDPSSEEDLVNPLDDYNDARDPGFVEADPENPGFKLPALRRSNMQTQYEYDDFVADEELSSHGSTDGPSSEDEDTHDLDYTKLQELSRLDVMGANTPPPR